MSIDASIARIDPSLIAAHEPNLYDFTTAENDVVISRSELRVGNPALARTPRSATLRAGDN
jgi:hypothetical protein